MPGSIYTKSGNAISLTGIHAYAMGEVLPKRTSSFYQRQPFLTFLTGKASDESNIGRPGTYAIVGGKGNFSKVDKEMAGGTEISQRVQDAQVGGGKWMGLRDTSPSTGNDSHDQHTRTAIWRWAQYKQPIKIWQATLDAAKGSKYKIGNAVKEATEEATEELFATLALSYYRGNPTDQTADRWDQPLGVLQAMDTDNTYANLNRSTASYWAGKRVTTAKAASLNLIDDANVTQGAMDKGPGIDFVLTSKAIYLKLKAEALARGQSVTVGDMPESLKVGAKHECIKYGNVTITYDPNLTGNWSAYDSDVTDATKLFLCFTSEDWIAYFHADYNFGLTPFVYLGDRPGGDDAVAAQLEVQTLLRCQRPWTNVCYTDVS